MARRIRKNVGVIGLGIIGSRVAENLRKKGYRVFVWNRTPRPVPNFVGSIGELAEMCDYIQIFVSDDEALTQVAEQLTPALAPRHIVFAHPTVSPHSGADPNRRTAAREICRSDAGQREQFQMPGNEIAQNDRAQFRTALFGQAHAQRHPDRHPSRSLSPS